jgi:hypothetical protein
LCDIDSLVPDALVTRGRERLHLAADEEGRVLLTAKATEASRWTFESQKGSFGAGRAKYIISNQKAPKGLKYLSIGKEPVKKLKDKDSAGKEREFDAYPLVLTAEDPPVWRSTLVAP